MQAYCRYWGKAGIDTKDGRKVYHLLPYHCLDVAAVGSVLLEQDAALAQKIAQVFGADKQICASWIVFFLALHDLGKFAEGFQNLRPDLLQLLRGTRSTRGYAVRHDSLGYALWSDRLWETVWHQGWLGVTGDQRQKRRWEKVFGSLAASATGHHGIPPTRTGPNNQRILAAMHFSQEEMGASERFTRDIAGIILGDLATVSDYQPEVLHTGAVMISWFIAGLTVLCDWIGSGHFELVPDPMPLDLYWRQHALPQARHAVAQTGILPVKASWSASASSLFPAIQVFTPLQRHAAECAIGAGPQLFILEDVTGSGKTEAALILAHRLMKEERGKGLFIALPTMATSNAMYERLAGTYMRLFETDAHPSLLLSHSARHLSAAFRQSVNRPDNDGYQTYENHDDNAGAHCAAWLADNRKKALLADVGVGTLDQALLAALPARYQSLRLYGLVRNILIVDEVHAYDPYMHVLLQNLLHFHATMGGSAILLSATIPAKMRRGLAQSFSCGLGSHSVELESSAYPLVTHVVRTGIQESAVSAIEGRKIVQRVELINDVQQVIDRIKWATEIGQCVCWIRNTVHDAILAYTLLEDIPPDRLILFHARFAMGDRLVTEEEVCSCFGKTSTAVSRKGRVLVATQVVEQSLDLDFDVLISDLAPIDLLIQRAGRLRRHPRDAQGNPLNYQGAIDLRASIPFLVHAPPPDDEAKGDWYSRAFPKASYVYPSHGKLWLTARLLAERGGWEMPEDARELVEAVYSGELEERIPAGLLARDDKEAGEQSAKRSLARLNALKVEEGYTSTPNQWLRDTRTPTRLGELQTTLRLARWDGIELSPWYPDGDFPWEMSQVSVRATLIEAEDVPTDERLRKAIEDLRTRLPDQGKWSVLVPLKINQTGVWQGTAQGPGGEKVVVTYDKKVGLQTSREGG